MMNMNQKGFINIAIIILIVAALGVAGYFVWNNWSSLPEPVGSPTTTETPESVLTTETTPASEPTIPVTNDSIPTTTEIEPDWQFVDADSFTLSLPSGWEFKKLQGVDSYVGEFVGDGAKLSFDYGWYSNSLADDNDPDHIVTYETIDGYEAKIVVPKITGQGTTGVYFADLGGEIQKTRFQISGRDLTASQQETALKIFRTIKITR